MLLRFGGPCGKTVLKYSSVSVSHPCSMVLLLLMIAFTMLLSESINLLYSLIFCRADCELHVCHPSSRHGVGQGLVLLWPRICLAAILCAMSSAFVCVVVRVVAARPHCAAFSTYTDHSGARMSTVMALALAHLTSSAVLHFVLRTRVCSHSSHLPVSCSGWPMYL